MSCKCKAPGPHLNIKTVFPRYEDSHIKDKTVAIPSYFLLGYILYWKGRHIHTETVPWASAAFCWTSSPPQTQKINIHTSHRSNDEKNCKSLPPAVLVFTYIAMNSCFLYSCSIWMNICFSCNILIWWLTTIIIFFVHCMNPTKVMFFISFHAFLNHRLNIWV